MTDSERLVYGILCPRRTKLPQFVVEAIPVRVLEVVRDARPHFDEMEVWHKSELRPDPVLVGCKKSGETWREPTRYILARWGSELDDFGALAQKALEIWAAKNKARLSRFLEIVRATLAEVTSCDVTNFLANAEHAMQMEGRSYVLTLHGQSSWD